MPPKKDSKKKGAATKTTQKQKAKSAKQPTEKKTRGSHRPKKSGKRNKFCYDFQKDACTRGDSCPFAHTKIPKEKAKPEKGAKKEQNKPKKLTKKKRSAPKKEYGLCYDFQKDACKRGSECPFKHERGVCHAFQVDKCTRGDACSYLHEKRERKQCPLGAACTKKDTCYFAHP